MNRAVQFPPVDRSLRRGEARANDVSWLLFLDESGHDHKNMPYEVRGGIALHAKRLWAFVQEMQRVELESFGCHLHELGAELKGSSLLDRKRFRFAAQQPPLSPDSRRRHARAFLVKSRQKVALTRDEFTAYGQACLEMARGTFQLLRSHEAVLFAAAIPQSVARPAGRVPDEFLRKDHVFLLERFFYFLEGKREHGLLVMDEVEKTADRKFVRQLESYFTRTATGRYRTQWIVPNPFFVSSDMTYPVQAADLCIYCVNLSFRLPSQGMNAAVRQEIADEFGPWLFEMQFRGQGYRDGHVYDSWGITYVPNPYGPGRV